VGAGHCALHESGDGLRDLPQRHTTSVVNGAYAIANPPYSLCGLGDLLRSSMLHCAHVEIEQTLALIALFLVLLSQFDDLFEDLHVKSFAFGLRKHLRFSMKGSTRVRNGRS